jgi:hypothetical protein
MPSITKRVITQLNVSDAQREALFASSLQPSDTPTADMVAEAITCALEQFGIGGCAGRMAQEYGDHPDTAAERMRWARQLAPGHRIALTGESRRLLECLAAPCWQR